MNWGPQCLSWTVTDAVPAGTVTGLVLGSWSSTAPAVFPLTVKLTEDPDPLMVRSIWCPSVVGKFLTVIAFPEVSQDDGMPWPTTSDPSDRWATIESSSVMLALAMPQAGGEEPLPDSGWVPVQGDPGFGNCSLSHQEYGPACPLDTMNS